ncbi:MAG: hypothetical protein KIT09_17430 [Bryobacteraceae bacterium]|nr:hypothetical protein [Bryobacteraceae bacterium]
MIVHGPMRGALLVLAMAAPSFSETRVDLKAQGRNVDFGSAAATKPFTVGTTLPGTCSIGQAFFKSDASAGQNLYLCTAVNSWTRVNSAELHAAAHKHGGVDEVASATAGANVIPKAKSDGKLDRNWLPEMTGDDGAGGQSGAVPAPGAGDAERCLKGNGAWGDCGGASPAPYIQQFLGASNPWTIAGTTHGLGANVEVFAQSDGGAKWNRISPASVEIGKSTGDVTVTWSKATAGRIMISRLQGSGGAGGGTMDHSQLTNLDYANSGHVGFAAENHGSRHRHGGGDEVATGTPGANAIPKADASGKLAAGWMPDLSGVYEALSRKNQASGYAGLDAAVKISRAQLPAMTGDQGSGGQTGAVPVPAAGDASKCLKGDATWGACGTGTGGAPGGASGQLQYNSSGVLGGVTGTSVSGSTIAHTGKIDLGGGKLGIPSGAGLPGSCVTGEVFLNTNALSGRRLYACEGGTWILQGDGNDGGSGGGGGGPIDAEYVVASANSTLTNEYVAQAGAGIVITKTSPNMRWEVDCSYVGCQGDDNNFSGNNQLGLGTKYLDFSVANDTATGTTLNKLVSWTNGDPVKAVRAPASSGDLLGICAGACGTSGSPRIAIRGRALCVFDSPPTPGRYVAVSNSTPGNCRDAGATKPSSGLVGVVYSAVSQGGAYEVVLMF